MLQKYKITNVKWDTDGLKIKLPKTLEIEIEVKGEDDEDIEGMLGDAISDKVGYCHFGFNYKKI